MVKIILIGIIILLIFIIIFYFLMKRIKTLTNKVNEFEKKEAHQNEIEKLKNDLHTGSNAEQFDSSLSILRKLIDKNKLK